MPSFDGDLNWHVFCVPLTHQVVDMCVSEREKDCELAGVRRILWLMTNV